MAFSTLGNPITKSKRISFGFLENLGGDEGPGDTNNKHYVLPGARYLFKWGWEDSYFHYVSDDSVAWLQGLRGTILLRSWSHFSPRSWELGNYSL